MVALVTKNISPETKTFVDECKEIFLVNHTLKEYYYVGEIDDSVGSQQLVFLLVDIMFNSNWSKYDNIEQFSSIDSLSDDYCVIHDDDETETDSD